MNKEKLFEAMGDIDEQYIKNARNYKNTGRSKVIRWTALTVAAALIITAVSVGPRIINTGRGTKPGQAGTLKNVSISAVYPVSKFAEMTAEEFMESEESWNWWTEYRDKLNASAPINDGLSDYYSKMMGQLLISEDENTVCSPINTYIAFAMLAEVTDGNSRKQILDMLGASDIEEVRENTKLLWESNYADTPMLQSLLANSLWLNNSAEYKAAVLRTLAEQYYASSYSGEPGSKKFDEQLRKWTDENTKGFLSDCTKDMSIDKDTVLEMVSTIYYKAQWTDDFEEDETAKGTFYGTSKTAEVDMMHKIDGTSYYSADAFTAISLNLNDSGSMYFYLPKDGVDVNSLASDEDAIKIALNTADDAWLEDHYANLLVNMSVPKFDISHSSDLIETLKRLGITDVLDPATSDFSPLTDEELFLSKANHAARLTIDENGVTGAAYTDLAMAMGTMLYPEVIDFVLDRPFMFVVTGADNSILFSGIVRNIE